MFLAWVFLAVLAICARVVSSATCVANFPGFNTGTDDTCECGTTTCNITTEGCNATASKCVCPPGSTWGTLTSMDFETTEACVLCGPVTADGRSQDYTHGYQCAGGSTTVVGDGKTICPAGTVDFRVCDRDPRTFPNGCNAIGTTACDSCPAGQYQDQEGAHLLLYDRFSNTPSWYVRKFFLFLFFPPLSFYLQSLALSQLDLIYFFNY